MNQLTPLHAAVLLRPGVDAIVLPSRPDVREFYGFVKATTGLQEGQVGVETAMFDCLSVSLFGLIVAASVRVLWICGSHHRLAGGPGGCRKTLGHTSAKHICCECMRRFFSTCLLMIYTDRQYMPCLKLQNIRAECLVLIKGICAVCIVCGLTYKRPLPMHMPHAAGRVDQWSHQLPAHRHGC